MIYIYADDDGMTNPEIPLRSRISRDRAHLSLSLAISYRVIIVVVRIPHRVFESNFSATAALFIIIANRYRSRALLRFVMITRVFGDVLNRLSSRGGVEAVRRSCK